MRMLQAFPHFSLVYPEVLRAPLIRIFMRCLNLTSKLWHPKKQRIDANAMSD